MCASLKNPFFQLVLLPVVGLGVRVKNHHHQCHHYHLDMFYQCISPFKFYVGKSYPTPPKFSEINLLQLSDVSQTPDIFHQKRLFQVGDNDLTAAVMARLAQVMQHKYY